MIALTIISIIVAFAALACAIATASRCSSAVDGIVRSVSSVQNDIAGLKTAVKEMETTAVDGLPGVTYDARERTLVVDGNVRATGYVSAGERKSED